MSKAGQTNYIGTYAEMDIALFYLIRACKSENFVKVGINSDKWEDITMFYKEQVEDIEIKWHESPLNYSTIQEIISKELNKDLREQDKFRIIAKEFSTNFKNDYNAFDEYLLSNKKYNNDLFLGNSTVRKLFEQNKWSLEQIEFLFKTEIVELSEDKIDSHIIDYFTFDDDFYLNEYDMKLLINTHLIKIMKKGRKGEFILREEFLTTLADFRKALTTKSESFAPELKLGEKTDNLADFILSEKEFIKLDNVKYLTPISDDRGLVLYLVKKLEGIHFSTNGIDFFIRKILSKKQYLFWAFRLLEIKRNQKNIQDEYIVEFIRKNFDNFHYDDNYYSVFQILVNIAEEDTANRFEEKFFILMESKVLEVINKDNLWDFKDERGWDEKQQISKIMNLYYQRTENKEKYIDFIFNYFSLIHDDFENVIQTHGDIYAIVKDFIKDNIESNFVQIIKKINSQYKLSYGDIYVGYELSGASIGRSGNEYSLADLGLVRLLFAPLFYELYQNDPQKTWDFIIEVIINKTDINADNPMFLRRAIVDIILLRIVEYQDDAEMKILIDILKIKEGIPQTSELIFSKLNRIDLYRFGFEHIMNLIMIDMFKYKSENYDGGYPTNHFVVEVLIRLIKENYGPAKELFLDFLTQPLFAKHDYNYNSCEMLVKHGISENDPDFIIEVFKTLDIETFVTSIEDNRDIWDKGKLLVGLIKNDWRNKTEKGKAIIDNLLKKEKCPHKGSLSFLDTTLQILSGLDPIKTYDLFLEYLTDKSVFVQTFKNNKYIRQNFVWLAVELAKNKCYCEAKVIIELCLDDSDPKTHNDEYESNYHLQVKKGKDVTTIATVRGKVPWVLQELALSSNCELMEYAFIMTEKLVDLDNSLATKLGYAEADLYVRLEALIPLTELARFPVRHKLDEYKQNLGNEVKNLAFKILRETKKQIVEEQIMPKLINQYLLRVFSNIRDLNTLEAKEIMEYFEEQNEESSFFLFIYFALFREEYFKDIPFEASIFKHKLNDLCCRNNSFREKISWQFWLCARDDIEKETNYFDRIEPYWVKLFQEYDKKVFCNIYRTLEITLKQKERYEMHKELLKVALKKEIIFHKTENTAINSWKPGSEIFEILYKQNKSDFLDAISYIAEGVDGNIHFYFIKEVITMFRSIENIPEECKESYIKIKTTFKNHYPEFFE